MFYSIVATAAALTTLEAKRNVLLALAGTDRGFKADKTQQAAVRQAIAALPASTVGTLNGNWRLAWTDAPDILGLPKFAQIGQEIDDRVIANVIEYPGLLEQRVLLNYVKSDDKVRLTFRGIALNRFDFTLIGLPFGEFTVLFNDDDMRVIRTGQGYYSVNLKI